MTTLLAITLGLYQRGYTGWQSTSWAIIHDTAHVLDLRLTDRSQESIDRTLLALSPRERLRRECLALAVNYLLCEAAGVTPDFTKRDISMQLWDAFPRCPARPEAIRSRIRRTMGTTYARTLAAIIVRMGEGVTIPTPVVLLPP